MLAQWIAWQGFAWQVVALFFMSAALWEATHDPVCCVLDDETKAKACELADRAIYKCIDVALAIR